MRDGRRRRTLTDCLLPAALAAAMTACGRGDPVAPPADLAISNPPPLYASLQSGLGAELRTVIRTQQAWAEFWQQLAQAGAGGPAAPPPVDFTTHMVVVAAMGPRQRAGYSVAITRYERSGGQGAVAVLSTVPPVACPSSPVMTSPAVATSLPISASVTFVELAAETPCPPR
jgi:hypothetical protein